MEATKTNNISDLYNVMMETITKLRDGSLAVENAKAINESAQVIVNIAKVECDYLKMAEKKDSKFLTDKNVAIEATLKEIAQKNSQPYQLTGKP